MLALPHSLTLTLNPDDCHSLSRFVVVCLSDSPAVDEVIRVPSLACPKPDGYDDIQISLGSAHHLQCDQCLIRDMKLSPPMHTWPSDLTC